MIYGLVIIGMAIGVYGMLLCAVNRKRTPKPGRDYDERGMYQ